MTYFSKKTVSALAGLGALALLATPAAAHGGGQGGYGGGFGGMMMGPGMMGGGPGFGQGFGPMMGPGMMGGGPGFGQGYSYGPMMGPGMMGPGFGPGGGFGPCGQQQGAAAAKDIDADAVKANLERWLAVQGNERLKLGKIEEVDDDVITAEIVTVDDSLVRKLTIDRHTGWMRPAR